MKEKEEKKVQKRIVIVDEQTMDPLRYYGLGLPHPYSVKHLQSLSIEDQKKLVDLGPGDAALLVGSEALKYIKGLYHVGIRRENYYDCSMLKRLGIEGGGFVKVIHESKPVLSNAELNFFLSPEFTKKREINVNAKIIETWSEAKIFLEYFKSLPLGSQLGFDYETSGADPFAEDLVVTGASLAFDTDAAFFSFTRIKEKCSEEEWGMFIKLFGETLWKHQSGIWTFNIQFETQVTFRITGLEMEFCDSGVYNVLDGIHSKNYSLKWTTQRLLGGGDNFTPSLLSLPDLGGIEPWDTHFDRLTDLLEEMYFTTVQDPQVKGKKGQMRVLKCTLYDYQGTDEWKEICKNYEEYIPEFIELIEKNFGEPFLNIPTFLLGYYCCLDSVYTLMIHMDNMKRYTTDARETFLDNMRLGATLLRGGMYKDEDFRLRYDLECSKMIAYGLTYAATARCKYKMEKHKKNAKPLKSYPKIAQKLIERGEFWNGEIIEIVKDILAKNINDCFDTGLDEGKLALTYGEDFAVQIIQIVKEAMEEVKFKGQIDSTITRKKKILGVIAEKLVPIIGLDKIKIDNRHLELEKLLYYEKAYKALTGVWKQMTGITKVPDKFQFMGQRLDRDDYSKLVQEKYFNCSSPIESAEITKDLTELFALETMFLTTIYESINILPDGKNFYKNLGILDIDTAYQHFVSEYKLFYSRIESGSNKFLGWPAGYVPAYPVEIWWTASRFWRDHNADEMTTTWDNFDGFKKQSTFFPDLADQWKDMSAPYDDFDWTDRFKFMRKMILHIMLAKKYMKVKSTYMNGLFKDNDRTEIDSNILIPIRKTSDLDPLAVVKMHPKYEVLKKETKRWSSPYHTIISHSDIKSCISCPKGMLLTYFDISSAEVRTCAYMSKDPVMINLFETRQDLYIHVAKIYFGEDRWYSEDGAFKKLWRGRFKTILLGVMYGMGTKTLSGRLGVSQQEAQELIDILFGQFKVLKGYIEENMRFPEEHDGFLNTLMGDTLRSPAWGFAFRSDGTPDKYTMSKVNRHGINYIIQSASALSLARGFYNNIREARKEGFVLSPIIVVHDSNTNYFPIDKLFEMKGFYDRNFTDFCEHQLKVPFLFDLFVGSNYNDACQLEQIDSNTLSIEGNAHSINQILWKINNESNLKVTLDVPAESIIPKYIDNPMQRFIIEEGTSMVMDKSKYKVVLTKITA